jgi:hypothetical protein
MFCSTVTLTTTSTSLYDLIKAVSTGKLLLHNGRVAEIQVHWLTGTFFLFDTAGPFGAGGPTAVDAGYQFSDPATDGGTGETLLVMRTGSANGLSLKDAYLGTTAGTATCRISAYSV